MPPLYEQKRIVAKIEELLPLVDRYAAAYEKLEQFNAKFPEDMKKSILQYAIQGKLVEQRAEEGTGEELYQQIQAEKQQLIEEKKIKKEKPLAEISEDEIPFDIPGSWKWVRVGEIFAHNTGKAMNSTAKKVDKPGSVKRFITTSNLYWNSFDFSSVKEMFFSDDELERCTVTKGDLLMCEGGAYYGRTAIWNYDYDICFQNHVHRLRPYPPGHNPHCHIMLTMRAIDENGKWLPKSRKVYDLDENGERIRLPSGNRKSHKENKSYYRHFTVINFAKPY